MKALRLWILLALSFQAFFSMAQSPDDLEQVRTAETTIVKKSVAGSQTVLSFRSTKTPPDELVTATQEKLKEIDGYIRTDVANGMVNIFVSPSTTDTSIERILTMMTRTYASRSYTLND